MTTLEIRWLHGIALSRTFPKYRKCSIRSRTSFISRTPTFHGRSSKKGHNTTFRDRRFRRDWSRFRPFFSFFEIHQFSRYITQQTWCDFLESVIYVRSVGVSQSFVPVNIDQASKLVKINGSKLLLLSLRAGSKTVFVVANLWGFERPRPIHGSYSGSACPQVCYNVINIMIYGRRGCILFGWWLSNVSRKVYGIIAVSCNKSNE